MIVEARGGNDVRRILTAIIMDKVVCATVASKWNPKHGLFDSDWANLVAGWAVRYYNRHKAPPGPAVEVLFDEWASTGKNDRELVDSIRTFILGLSDEYDRLGRFSPDFILDKAARYFNIVQGKQLAESIQLHAQNGDVDKMWASVQKTRKVEMGLGSGVDLFSDIGAMKKASRETRKALLTMPDALGNFFGFALERDGFIGIIGKNKIGKSFWLMDIGWRAAEQGLKVAFFGIGDMSQSQYYHRFMARVMGRPYLGDVTFTYPKDILVPPAKNGFPPELDTEEMYYKEPLDPKLAWTKFQEIKKRYGYSTFKLSCHANGSIGTSGINSILEGWTLDGWVPDVVVIDYADLLTHPPGFDPSDRGGVNQNWKDMRQMSQVLHCLVVTASQGDTNSFDAPVLTRKYFNTDRRILDHVTGMVGLNQSSEELKNGVIRLNWINARDWPYNEEKCVSAVGCLAIANPAILSCF